MAEEVRRPKRRNAVKQNRIVEIKGHKFVLTYFKQFTFCGHCTRFLWGVTGPQGYRCISCDFTIHKRCLDYVSFICPGTNLPEGLEPRPHHFKTAQFFHPTFCTHCGSMIYGLFNQGVRCTDCQMTAHHRCQKLVPRACGTDHQEKRGRILLAFYTEKLSDSADDCTWRINIEVLECKNLPPMDANGLADPFVKLYLVDNRGKRDSSFKQKSERREKTLNPHFDETFFFDVKSDMLTHRLVLEVWDWDRLSADDYVGGLSLGIQELIEETRNCERLEAWYKLLDQGTSRTRSIRIIADDEADRLIKEYQKSVHSNKLLLKEELAGAGFGEIRRPSELIGLPGTSNLPRMDLDSFSLLLVLGKGSFGKVFLAEHKPTKEVYAIKSLKKDLIVQEDDVECTLNERKVLALQNKSPFLTNMHSCFQTQDHLFFVMEYINGGDLMFHILEMGRFPENQTRFYAAEIILGLIFLHEMGIIYRDLKLDNVMLNHEGHIKIADFGLCKEGISGDHKTRTFCGTPDYIAPEIISYQPYNASVDWWALGVLIYEMLIGRPPFDGDDDDQLFTNIMEKPVHYPRGLSESSRGVIQGFLTKHPQKRLGCHPENGATDIKKHPFFKPIDWDKLARREIKPPYKPKIKGKKSANNFDPEFTKETTNLSPVDPQVVAAIAPEVFEGFSFTNPELYGGTPSQ